MLNRDSLLLRFLLLLLITLGPIGCSDDEPRDATPVVEEPIDESIPFAPPEFENGRILDTIIGLNLDDDPDLEQIVASLSTTIPYPSEIRADRLDVYDLDARGEWDLVARDTALWYQSWSVRDLTGDGIVEFIAKTWGGGNDEVAGRGISIISGEGGPIRTIFQRSGGAPRVYEHDGEPLLLISSLFWPEFLPHVAAVPIVEEVLTLKGGETRADYTFARSYFDWESEVMRRELEIMISEKSSGNESGPQSKPSPEVQAKIFSLAIQTLRGIHRGESSNRLDDFRKEIMPRLKSLLEEEQMMMIEDEVYGP